MNKMREIKIEKVVLSMSGTGENLEKGVKLLSLITGRKPSKRRSHKRIPAFGVRPKLEVGAMVTLRENFDDLIRRMLATKDNTLKRSQIKENSFSFGVKEYIEIPGIEYQRDIGIMGFDVSVAFQRAGRRVKLKKIKEGKVPKRNDVTKEEIIKFMEDKFKTNFI